MKRYPNRIRESWQRKVFQSVNIVCLTLSALLCFFPLLHIFAISLSSSYAASAGKVTFYPVQFTLASYRYVMSNTAFWRAFSVSLLRIGLALPLTLGIIILSAYPMSKDKKIFKGRAFYTYFLLIPMLFSGGLIPGYVTLNAYGLLDSIWALVLPTLTPVFSIVLMMNFIRDLPKEIEEAAFIDGAGPLRMLYRIVVPLCAPSIATVALFCLVGHWNSWLDGILYMNHPRNYPLQSFLQTVIVSYETKKLSSKDLELIKIISDRTTRAAQVIVGAIPILIVYPFLQKYFTKGLILGSVKS